MDEMEMFRQQHLNTYKNAVKEIIVNNTKALVENDIISLIKKPPLDSMDQIKTKLISLAKKEKIVLNTTELENLVSNFRKHLEFSLLDLKKIRENELVQKVELFMPERETEIIKIQKKDMDCINKKLKQNVKKNMESSFEKELFNKIDNIYNSDISSESKDSINKTFVKFMKSSYQKQLNENIAIKTLVKDRTLMSGIMEQGERYLFTKTNSHLFDENMQNAK